MPRLKPTAIELVNRQARAVLDDYFTSRGTVRIHEMARLCGFSEFTAAARYRDPGTFRVSELRGLKGMSDEQLIRFIKG